MKIHELTDLKDTSNVLTLDDERGLDNMDWSEDGQLLAVSTSKVGGGNTVASWPKILQNSFQKGQTEEFCWPAGPLFWLKLAEKGPNILS